MKFLSCLALLALLGVANASMSAQLQDLAALKKSPKLSFSAMMRKYQVVSNARKLAAQFKTVAPILNAIGKSHSSLKLAETAPALSIKQTFDYSNCDATTVSNCKATADAFVAGECWKLSDELQVVWESGNADINTATLEAQCDKCGTVFTNSIVKCGAIFKCATAPGYTPPTDRDVKEWANAAGPLVRVTCSKDSSGTLCAGQVASSIKQLSSINFEGSTGFDIPTSTMDSICNECLLKLAKASRFAKANKAQNGGHSTSGNTQVSAGINMICMKHNGNYCLPELAKVMKEIQGMSTASSNDPQAMLDVIKKLVNLMCGDVCVRRLMNAAFAVSGDTSAAQMMQVFCLQNEKGERCLPLVFEGLIGAIQSQDISQLPGWLLVMDSCYATRSSTCKSSTCAGKFTDSKYGCCVSAFVIMTASGARAIESRCKYGLEFCPKSSKKATASIKTGIDYAVYQKQKTRIDNGVKKDVSETTGAAEGDITVEGKETSGAAAAGNRLLAGTTEFDVTISGDDSDAVGAYGTAMEDSIKNNDLTLANAAVVVAEETGGDVDSVVVVDTQASSVTGAGSGSGSGSTLAVSGLALAIATVFALLF